MKRIMAIISLLPISLFGQSKHTLTLELSTGDCRTNENVRIGFKDTIRFYQHGKLYAQIIPMNYTEWPIEIENFNPGIYSVTFKNLYHQKTTKTIIIPDSSEYELQLCPDKLLDYPLNAIQTLREGEDIKIMFSSIGCFHQNNEVLSISKQSNSLVAKLSNGTATKSVVLNQRSVDAFIRFENEIREIKDSRDCTTVDTYQVISKSWTIKRVDGGCDWNGFYHLKKTLFLNE